MLHKLRLGFKGHEAFITQLKCQLTGGYHKITRYTYIHLALPTIVLAAFNKMHEDVAGFLFNTYEPLYDVRIINNNQLVNRPARLLRFTLPVKIPISALQPPKVFISNSDYFGLETVAGQCVLNRTRQIVNLNFESACGRHSSNI